MSTWLDRRYDFDVPTLPCTGKGWLYFADDDASQRAAARLCASCPVLMRCRRRGDALERDAERLFGVLGGETGPERQRRRLHVR